MPAADFPLRGRPFRFLDSGPPAADNKGVAMSALIATISSVPLGGLFSEDLPGEQEAVRNLVLSLGLFALMVLVAFYVVGKIRARAVQKEPASSEMLSKFRELHSQGELSDEEYREIKTSLAAQFQQELRGNSQTG